MQEYTIRIRSMAVSNTELNIEPESIQDHKFTSCLEPYVLELKPSQPPPSLVAPILSLKPRYNARQNPEPRATLAQNWVMYQKHTNLSPPTSIQAQPFSLAAHPPSHHPPHCWLAISLVPSLHYLAKIMLYFLP